MPFPQATPPPIMHTQTKFFLGHFPLRVFFFFVPLPTPNSFLMIRPNLWPHSHLPVTINQETPSWDVSRISFDSVIERITLEAMITMIPFFTYTGKIAIRSSLFPFLLVSTIKSYPTVETWKWNSGRRLLPLRSCCTLPVVLPLRLQPVLRSIAPLIDAGAQTSESVTALTGKEAMVTSTCHILKTKSSGTVDRPKSAPLGEEMQTGWLSTSTMMAKSPGIFTTAGDERQLLPW